MNFTEASLFVLFIAIISVPIATRFRLPLEIFLVIGSCIISMIPGLPDIQLNPTVVFNLFLPPILFSAAYFTSWRDFKFNLRPITMLAFGLVIFTTLVVAVVAKYLIPGFGWGECFLLGSIISPTDASSATSIVKKLGAPRRFIAILEGESLVNDATALILYRFSLAAIIQGSFSMTEAVTQFFIISIGGAIVGLGVAVFAIFILKKLKDVSAETTFTFITAFTSYLAAEHFGVSGVISTVVAGLFFGTRFSESAPSSTRLSAKAAWNTLIFIINGFAFALIGFELPHMLHQLVSYSISDLIIYAVVISLVVIIIRLLYLFPAAYIPRILFPSISRKDPMPSWRFLFALGWTGMRGIVSLAAVLAVANTTINGARFPHADLLIFITYSVIVATLVVPSMTLPSLLRVLHLTDAQSKMKEEAVARVRATEEVLKAIEDYAKVEKIPETILSEYRNQLDRKLKVIKTQIDDVPYSVLSDDYLSYRKLTHAAIRSEKETLIKLRRTGEIHDEVFRRLIDELDLEEIRARSLRI